MALSKIQAESMNLADTYAFTGTVSGTSSMVLVGETTATAAVSYLDISGLDTTYTNLMFVAHLFLATDNTSVRMRFLNDSDVSMGGGSDYHFARFKYQSGVATGSGDNSHGYMDVSPTIGSASEEDGISLVGNIYGVGTNYPLQVNIHCVHEDEGSAMEGGLMAGGMKDKSKTFGGIRLYASSGNLETNSYIKMYGLVNS